MIQRKIFDPYLAFCARKRVEGVRRSYSDPPALQKKTLFYILNKAGSTEFGRKYGLDSIKSIGDYQKRLPLFTYDDMEHWVEKALDGRPDVLWPGRTWDFALTSGTSGRNKHIPVSRELMASNKRAAFDCLAFCLNRDEGRSLLKGRFLFLGGSTSLRRLKTGAFAGDLSGIATRHIPFLLERMYEPGRRIASIPDWLDKIDEIARREADVNISGVSGMPAWLLVFFDRLLAEAGRRRDKDIRTVSGIWPDISLLIHGGVNFEPFRNRFRRIIGKDISYFEVYPASEAFVAMQDGKSGEGLLLMLDYGSFYEFVPAGEIGKTNPSRLTVADIEIGKNYALILTNNSGLFSYIIGDTVKFVSLDPPRLLITGRIENFLSAFGEHLIVEEAEAAVDYACKKTGSEVEEFTAAPFFPERMEESPHHQWLIEFRREPRDMEEFTGYIDERLREMNADYNAHRGRGAGVYRPKVVPVKRGAFYAWLASEGRLGGQHKVPRLKNDRSIADRLLKFN